MRTIESNFAFDFYIDYGDFSLKRFISVLAEQTTRGNFLTMW